mmetsp:Transcript_77335/g.224370  ORF Transcript_77335/g.224370 Transcript_77335/m.224370 type:complete len:193 (-) Transcript_77335:62-640(-)|eukprot:CAMPEP_0176116180 /NCGR_PEP_ID=MMETSP0120_2-20121206/58348_1 /TAXON_ID=160619 /ORGANISM="Kryptoperidinium foliaceum, Strain CCMP 1326" /LENGTH=192 /DNA_ID=CAMNT_0017450429 /DNA_START=59 /DNA_END=637 /DNA_ORIENTATION=-
MSKACDKCQQPYRGFGATCASCRSKKAVDMKQCCECSGFFAGASTKCSDCSGAGGDKCSACGKTAYVVERIQIEGLIFHASCFKCTHCGNKLSVGAFSKAEQGKFYCKPHYEQLFKLRGRYSLGGKDTKDVRAIAEALRDDELADKPDQAVVVEQGLVDVPDQGALAESCHAEVVAAGDAVVIEPEPAAVVA